jgi:hypothetical protein
MSHFSAVLLPLNSHLRQIPNFSIPVGNFNSANFGKIQSAADPRIL